MRTSLLKKIRCPACMGTDLRVEPSASDEREIREGSVICRSCGQSYTVSGGVLDLLYEPSPVVLQERAAVHRLDEVVQFRQPGSGEGELIHQALCSLPDGLDHPWFTEPGSWKSICDLGPCFYEMLDMLCLPRGTSVLEVGADTCWAVNRLSQRGCRCVAVDITGHLACGDHYIMGGNTYFDRVIADMNRLPFGNQAFDVVLAVGAMHHTGDLRETLAGCARVVRGGGRVVLYNEPFADNDPNGEFGQAERAMGINEHNYLLEDWLDAAEAAGLRARVYPLLSDLKLALKDKAILQRWRKLIPLCSLKSWGRSLLSLRRVRKWIVGRPGIRYCIVGERVR